AKKPRVSTVTPASFAIWPIFTVHPLTLDLTPELSMYVMSDVLHFPARPDAPIACDISTAVDTPDQRLDAYARLFADALVRRERRDGIVVLAFRADPETRA